MNPNAALDEADQLILQRRNLKNIFEHFNDATLYTAATQSIATFGFSHKVPMLKVFRTVSFYGREE
jgi:hypothetical protein